MRIPSVDLTLLTAAELDALEQINLWRVAKVGPQLFDLVYASLFRVTVPCEKFSPIFPKIEITRTKVPPPRFRDHFPIFTDTTMRVAQQRARSMQNLGVKHVRPISCSFLLFVDNIDCVHRWCSPLETSGPRATSFARSLPSCPSNFR